jgi:hypothetical protein
MGKTIMDTLSDMHVEAARVQQEIKSYLGLRTSDMVFEYSTIDGKIKLDLITINPRHNQAFLFHSETGADKVDALRKMLDYVQSSKEKENSYTIQWVAKGDKELNTSYFRASNVLDALQKLYYGRDMNTITVFSVVLNPVS